MDEVIGKLQAAYDRVKFFPEDSPKGWIDLIELRNLVPDALLLLTAQKKEIEQLRAGRDA